MPAQIYHVKDWTVELMFVGDTLAYYRIYSEGPERNLKYYQIVMGQFCQPIVIQEPSLGLDCPSKLTCFNKNGDPVVPDQKIVGIVCKNGPRFSLTNAKAKGIVINVSEENHIQINGESWFINTLYMPDKNRLIGYVAFCSKEINPSVRVLEMGDLDLF
jgi:hypothetical protein